MKKLIPLIVLVLTAISASSEIIEKTFSFNSYTLVQKGEYYSIQFDQTRLAGKPGNPALPYQAVSLILPPGESAVNVEFIGEDEVAIPGTYLLYPMQEPLPLSQAEKARFIKDEMVYATDKNLPENRATNLQTQYLNGYAIAMCTFTPVVYNPVTGSLSYFANVRLRITTAKDARSEQALRHLSSSEQVLNRVKNAVANPGMLSRYPSKPQLKSGYQILVITPAAYQSSYTALIDHYAGKSMTSQVITTEFINSSVAGQDLAEKTRNYIIQEYQNNSIEYVLLGGDVEMIPARGFYCYVISGSGYEEYNIPADLYYSALDGNWNTNGNSKWGEPGEDDLLPEVSVARFPFSTSAELENMIHKSVTYQENPIPEEIKEPFLVGEHLYSDPMTWGQDYLELLIDDHNDNGYFTHGIPSADNDITRLYDTLISMPSNIYSWDAYTLINKINEGKSFIHHSGHSNVDYMMRLMTWDITNQNFSGVDGITHNYTLMYTHGCLCGAFDEECIAEKCVTIDNFLAGGVFNSRYGWFDQGLTEGPSAHLHREFISALYNDTLEYQVKQIGSAHMVSKIKTAPWVDINGEFEPGAQRWCHYACNVLGDPAMIIWTDEPSTAVSESTQTFSVSVFPNPATTTAKIMFRGQPENKAQISIYAQDGKKLETISASIGFDGTVSVNLDVAGYPTGMYHLMVTSGAHTSGTKLMVSK